MKIPKQPDLIERARAARCLVDCTRNPQLEMAAFMELFHPDFGEQRTQELIRETPKHRTR